MSDLEADDEDRAPPSIYDGDDVHERAPWFDAPPSDGPDPAPRRCPTLGDEAADWAEAEAAMASALADTASAVARLDEALLGQPPGRRAGLRRHLALVEIADLVWAEGHRLRPEKLALVDADRLGRTDHDTEVLGRAASALRRALAPPQRIDTAEAVATALGSRIASDGPTRGADDPVLALLPTLASERADGWLTALHPLDAHPLTKAGFGARLWLRGDPGQLLDPATLASRLWMTGSGPRHAGAEIGLSFLPLAFARPPTELLHGRPAEDWLASWLAAVRGAAARARSHLRALAAWREREALAMAGMRGRGAPALADLRLDRPIVSAPIAAAALGLTAARTRDLLAAFERRGLTREMTGQGRFRYWQPVL
ncbi:MAG: helix-turn-helix domain-containing protein [Pseudomonadota bacterium]